MHIGFIRAFCWILLPGVSKQWREPTESKTIQVWAVGLPRWTSFSWSCSICSLHHVGANISLSALFSPDSYIIILLYYIIWLSSNFPSLQLSSVFLWVCSHVRFTVSPPPSLLHSFQWQAVIVAVGPGWRCSVLSQDLSRPGNMAARRGGGRWLTRHFYP